MTPTRCLRCGAYTYPQRGVEPRVCDICGDHLVIQRMKCTECKAMVYDWEGDYHDDWHDRECPQYKVAPMS